MQRFPHLRTIYLIATALLPILLCYPTMIYADLAGMGGYDGFASVALMMQHGAWRPAGEATRIYYLFATTAFIWMLSLINLLLCSVVVSSLFGYTVRKSVVHRFGEPRNHWDQLNEQF